MASFHVLGIFLLMAFSASLCHALAEEPDVTKCVKNGGGHVVCSSINNKGCVVTFKTMLDENNHTQIKSHYAAVTQQGCTETDRDECEFGKSTQGEDIVRCYCQWNSCNVKAIVQEYLDEFNANTTTTTTTMTTTTGKSLSEVLIFASTNPQ